MLYILLFALVTSSLTHGVHSLLLNGTTPGANSKSPPLRSDKLIVIMKDNATLQPPSNRTKTIAPYGEKLDVINGYIVDGSQVSIETLRADPNVLRVEEDKEFVIAWNGDSEEDLYVTRHKAPWGLERLTRREALKKQDALVLDYDYHHYKEAGKGVDIYIIDTGVRLTHEEFGGRARWGATFGGYPDVDGHGHGTHCAGTAAGKQFGVSNRADIIAVRVLDDRGHGLTADILSGMEWVYGQVQRSTRPSIVSMSLIGPANEAIDLAVATLTKQGVHVVVAAGNDDYPAKYSSPARAPEAITVGATDIWDTRAWFSNYGPVVDIHAPGYDVISAWGASDNATNIGRGTSMATPHVSGLVAYIISLKGNMSPRGMSRLIKTWGIKDVLHNFPEYINSTNLLAHIRKEKSNGHELH